MNKKIIYLFAFFVLINQVVYSQNVCSICEKLKNNVVKITSTFSDGREENGFGTVIAERDNKLYIVTAKHVVYTLDDRGFVSNNNSTKTAVIKFLSDLGKDYSATLLNLPATSLDISLLEVEKPKNYTWTKESYSNAIETGTKVWFIGRSGKWYIPTGSFVGSVNEISGDDEIIIDINSIQPGTSGAPLISSNGIVGLIFEDAADGAKAYPIEKIIKLLTKTWNYPWQMNLKTDVTQPATGENKSAAVNRANAKETAAAILTAYKAKDYDLLFTYLSKENQRQITSPSDWKARQASIVGGWRWEAVSGWNGKIDDVRFRHFVGTASNEYEANVKFAEISKTEFAVVTLVLENGIWTFEDIHSPDATDFYEGLPVFSSSSEPY